MYRQQTHSIFSNASGAAIIIREREAFCAENPKSRSLFQKAAKETRPMPVFLLIYIPCLTFTVQTIAMKSVHARILRQNLLITGILSALIAAGFGVYALFAETHFSPLTFVLGAVFGAVYVTTLVSYYYAMQTGPLSYSSFFYSASMLIPALAGLLIWKEPFTWQAGAGIALFLAAFYLVSVPGAAKGQKISGKWLLFCFMSWLFNGGCSLSVKAHQMAMEGREGNEMLLVGYCTAALLSFGLYAVLRAKQGPSGDFALVKAGALPLVLAAAGNGGGNAMVSYLASRVDSAYLYPIVLGGLLILVSVYSVCFLKEKMNRAGFAGLALGIAAIAVMNL